jgi:hypothetical protein
LAYCSCYKDYQIIYFHKYLDDVRKELGKDVGTVAEGADVITDEDDSIKR